jgi:hypothetical protein
MQCLCCAAVLSLINMSLSSGERDSCFFLCASALVSKKIPFSQDEGTHVVSCVHQHHCIIFELCSPVRETVNTFVVQRHV